MRNLGPIRHVLLTPSPGMTAITGETGAGKSMLLNAIRLISGQTPDTGRVRGGSDESWVQGVFAVDPQGRAAAIAREAGAQVEVNDNELFLTRIVPAGGRSRAMLSGHSVPRSVLADIAGESVTIHGQSDQLKIASEARQRDFLDMVAGDEAELDAYGKAWDALRALDRRLARIQSQEASARERAEYLRNAIDRINAVDPQPAEDEQLKERRDHIEHATQIAQGVEEALSALDSSQVDVDTDGSSATDLINHAAQSLRAIHLEGVFSQAADRLESLNADLADIVFSLSHEVEDEPKVEDLDTLNERIHSLAELTRNWGPTLRDVIAWRDQAVFEVEDLDASPEKIDQLRDEREQLAGGALQAANTLSQARAAAARRLSAQVDHELAALAMSGSHLDISVSPRGTGSSGTGSGSADAAGAGSGSGMLDVHGVDDIAFLFTPFPGSPQMPMGKSASGGELSRLMLALELSANAQQARHSGMTFIFDEVDAGVGGKAAVELGRRLARLSRHAQVIVVTHLAQVASWADAQFVVSKDEDADAQTLVTTVSKVDGEPRVREIARMLSGSESATSLEHAQELIAESRLSEQS